MYHINSDKRCIKSAELIYEGLLKCLKNKSFEQITVTDIQKSSGVARTTFYRCFDNISDILYWRCDMCFGEAFEGLNTSDVADENILIKHYFSYWLKHSGILELLISINRQDIIYSCHMKKAEELEKIFGELPGMTEKEKRYFMAIRSGVTISVLKAWLDGGCKESAEEVLNIINMH